MINGILLQAAPSGGGMTTQLLFMVAIVAVFYFFMIRPQQKKAKDQKKFTEEIKVGDKVVTIGGAHGRVAELDGDTFVLEVERGGRIRYSKSAISMESSKAVNTEKKA
jgi:preprotein translocase subunit YajC